MIRTRTLIFRLFSLLAAMLVGLASAGGAFELTRQNVDGGGGRSFGGSFELNGTIGQPEAGIASRNTFDLYGGFWFPQTAGDCDADGAVGLSDYMDLIDCFAGPGSGLVDMECGCFDFDGSGGIDLMDFAEFQVLFGS